MTSKKKPPEEKPAAALSGVNFEDVSEAVGSRSAAFQITALGQALEALWQPGWKSEEIKQRELQAILDTLRSIAPRSELEGMLAVQMIGTHSSAMECLRRAMIDGQGFESRNANLKMAAKLMSLYERQLAALDKRRGKGQKRITVEHVTVEAGGQAIVGDVSLAKDDKTLVGNGQLGDEGAGSIGHSSAQENLARQAAGRGK